MDKLDTVRKLLTKAEGAATTEEAEAYNDKARVLMARHGIDAALLAEAGAIVDEIGGRKITIQDPYSAEKAQLLGWIALAMRCRAMRHQAPRYRGQRGVIRIEAVTIFGYGTDLDRIELLYTSLLMQAAHQVTRVRPTRPGESVAAYRRSWFSGFGAAVYRRLRAAEEQAAAVHVAESAGTSTALVLVDRSTAVERAYRAAFPNARTAGPTSMSGSGYGDGTVAGQRAVLTRGQVGARRSAING